MIRFGLLRYSIQNRTLQQLYLYIQIFNKKCLWYNLLHMVNRTTNHNNTVRIEHCWGLPYCFNNGRTKVGIYERRCVKVKCDGKNYRKVCRKKCKKYNISLKEGWKEIYLIFDEKKNWFIFLWEKNLMTDIFSSALKVRCQKLQLRWKILPEKLKVTIFLHISLCGKFLSAFYFFYSCVLGGQYFFLFSTVNHCNLSAYYQGRAHDLTREGGTWGGWGGEKRRPTLALHTLHEVGSITMI